jgi:hypothetical protein
MKEVQKFKALQRFNHTVFRRGNRLKEQRRDRNRP